MAYDDNERYVYTDADAPPELEERTYPAPPAEELSPPPPRWEKHNGREIQPVEGFPVIRLVPETDPFFACFKPLCEFPEEETDWLVEGLIPWGQITLLAADGGVGKTSIWVELAAAISSGENCFLDGPEEDRCPMHVMFLTTEDSIRKKLRKKLRLAGAWMEHIIAPDFMADGQGALRDLKFGSYELERLIRHFRPVLCVFDPIQGFIPPEVNMGSRNAMRDCLAPLVSLGEETGTTFLIVCHTNKRKGASGRDRIADSADLWDIARSVLMAGYAGERGVRYLSNEKNNYAPLQETRLFTLGEEGEIIPAGTTWKRDRDFSQESQQTSTAPKREDCKAWVLDTLDVYGGSVASKELEKLAEEEGYSYATLRRVKDALKREGAIRNYSVGNTKENKLWYVQLVPTPSETPR